MNTNARVLIVEDELPMRTALVDCLTSEGYRVLAANDGETGLEKAVQEKPDLIVLDVMMPRLDGFTLCAELRRLLCTMPILILTAKGRVEDRVRGLDLGADDFLVKPFSREELLARVRALLRRTSRPQRNLQQLTFGDVCIDFSQQRATRSGKALHLTTKEFGMLQLMAAADGEAVSRERFLDVVWGYTAFPTTRTVDRHIVSLRNKLEPDPESPRWIHTVHGFGYRLDLQDVETSKTGEVTKREQPDARFLAASASHESNQTSSC
ncbi:response regulator transcription factor [Verrucomicrobiota bacterium sgz303538]